MATQEAFVAAFGSVSSTDIKQPITTEVQMPQNPQTPLPAGWVEMKDPSGRTMYLNTANGMSSWQRPVVRQLPAGWVKAQTPDGKPLFVHSATQQCSFEWPSEVAKPASVVPPNVVAPMPQMTRYTSTPAQPSPQPLPASPRLARSTTAPVQTPIRMPVKVQDPALMTMTVNTAVARKAIPGFDEAVAIHQLSQRNNTQVLGKKLGSDMAHASLALKDTTITAASLATRQAKAVGSTMMSATKMQKASKKAVVHTGALGVKFGRASMSLMHEMVDAADGKGRYKPKVRTFIPQDPVPEMVHKPNMRIDVVHAYEYEQAATSAAPQQVQQVVVPAQPVCTGVPMRKPVKRPMINASLTANASLQFSTQATEHTPSPLQPEQSHIVYADAGNPSQLQPSQQVVAEKPTQASHDVNASLEVSANAAMHIEVPTTDSMPPEHHATIMTDTPDQVASHQQPLQQSAAPAKPTGITSMQQAQQTPVMSSAQPQTVSQPQSSATGTTSSLTLQADANLNATLTLQQQTPSANQPPPPYSPQTQQVLVQRPPRPASIASYSTPQYVYSTTPVSPPSLQPVQQTQQTQQLQHVQYTLASQQSQQVQHMSQVQQTQSIQLNHQAYQTPQYQQHQVQYITPSQPATYQQQPQQIIIQQDSQANSYIQSSNMLALQQQMQALQMQQQVSQMQDMQQQQMLDQQLQQQQLYATQAQPIATQQPIQYSNESSDVQGGDVYFIDDSTTTNMTLEDQNAYQVQPQYTPITQSGDEGVVMYAQETTTVGTYTTADGHEVIYVDEQQEVAYADAEGGVVYAEEQEVVVYEEEEGGVAAGGLVVDSGEGLEEIDVGGGFEC